MLSLSAKASFEAQRDVPPNQDPSPNALFKGAMHQDPERLHRIEPRIFVRVRLRLRSLDVCALSVSHPLHSPRETPSCPREGRPLRATRLPRHWPCGRLLRLAGEILLSDFCNQLSDTSTRGPFNSRVEGFRLPIQHSSHCAVTKAPCGDSVSGGSGLDGSPPTSANSITALPKKNRPQGDTTPRRYQPRAEPMSGL